MLPDTSENICVLEKQLRAIFLLAKRSPEGKLPFVRRQQFFQIGDDLFMRLLRIEPRPAFGASRKDERKNNSNRMKNCFIRK